ncbi:MAG TPA: ABC transporter ATP-binding protein [Actinomycetota bacterium]|nr:ABC transporter ATP-binding protein [Actinomycetota bacterium]
MSLEARVCLSLGTLKLDVEIRVPFGEVLAVLGPNGSGKTTLLRALAGLVPLESGRIVLDGVVLEDPAGGIRKAPYERPTGFVFQDYLLFPHLTVAQNVAFGLAAAGTPRSQARAKAREWLAAMGLEAYAGAKPGSLSGGQAQRAALARALAPQPRLLLLDEPLAALDAGTKLEVRRELSRHLRSFSGSALLVTHNPLEAAALADRLIVLEGGRVIQEGTSTEVAQRPRSPYVAELVGLNLIRGKGLPGGVETETGGTLVVPSNFAGEVFAAIHPRAVALHRERPQGSPRNVWQGTVAGIDLEGDRARVNVDGPVKVVAEVTTGALKDLDLAAAGPVWVSIKATEIQVYPA